MKTEETTEEFHLENTVDTWRVIAVKLRLGRILSDRESELLDYYAFHYEEYP